MFVHFSEIDVVPCCVVPCTRQQDSPDGLPTKQNRLDCSSSQGGGPRKEVLLVYTEYGYTVNGIEYSTIDEALEAQRADDDD